MQEITHIPFAAYIGASSSIVVVAVGVWRYSALRPEIKVLLGFLALSLALNAISLYLALRGINNLWLYHIVTLLEFTALVLVLSAWEKRQRRMFFFRLIAAGFFVVWLMAKIFVENLRQFDSYSSSLSSVLLVGGSCYFLWMLSQESLFKPHRDFRFWVLAAVLVDHSTRILLYALSNVILIFPMEDVAKLWSYQWIVATIANGLFLGSFLCKQSQ